MPPLGRSNRPAAVPPGRLSAIDKLRGLVMVLMVLDHALFYFTDPSISPVDLSRTTPGLFLSEWVTHYCAPVFFLLAGVGTYLQIARGATKREVAKFLLIRGLLLIVLDMTVVQWALYFRFDFSLFVMQPDGEIARIFVFTPLVLWGLGLSMIMLAAVLWLPTSAVGIFGITLILVHNMFDQVNADYVQQLKTGESAPWAWLVLHQVGTWLVSDQFRILIDFPLIPWVGVMAAGYGLGPLFLKNRTLRRRVLALSGAAMILAFLSLRELGRYGDPAPFKSYAESFLTVLSFINCEKYPASLQFLLMTLGPALLVLAVLDREPAVDGSERLVDRILRPFRLFGRVPLFFYLGQWVVLHFLALALAWIQHRPTDWLFKTLDIVSPQANFPDWDPTADVGLRYVYGAWILSVLLLYPACLWFARLKDRHRDSWLRYF